MSADHYRAISCLSSAWIQDLPVAVQSVSSVQAARKSVSLRSICATWESLPLSCPGALPIAQPQHPILRILRHAWCFSWFELRAAHRWRNWWAWNQWRIELNRGRTSMASMMVEQHLRYCESRTCLPCINLLMLIYDNGDIFWQRKKVIHEGGTCTSQRHGSCQRDFDYR